MNSVAAKACSKCGAAANRVTRGLCKPCYSQDLAARKSAGTYVPRPIGAKARILANIEINDAGCWIWRRSTHPENGYGQMRIAGGASFVHRVAYEVFVGPIPEGLEIDHRCHSDDPTCMGGPKCLHRPCCNPAHLEATTTLENNRRSKSPSAANGRKTHCSRGHEFTVENTNLRTYQTQEGIRQRRECRECARIWRKARDARLAALGAKKPQSSRKAPEQLSTHCKHGHEYTPDNTYQHPNSQWEGTHRSCRKCNSAARARYLDRKRKAMAEDAQTTDEEA